ncbi:hypothetical protein [Bradyrhizobium prioriisuperbiae]|uniref:hypothetical protein n=1 Tax=Bradyrhizobium prioriisuperbiae TaxID=2854389 RepID=UPI0028ECBF8B|nr:hypothetical protein [Bradyrhizobium prioritasuperba]
MSAAVKRNIFRSPLAIHFIGIALLIGSRLAVIVIDRQTSHSGLQVLALGQDFAGDINKSLGPLGLLIMVATGVAMSFLRYGRRPPIWVRIKVGLNLFAFLGVALLGAPAFARVQLWAHWSADHNQLAPQFQPAAAQADLYSVIVFALLLVNIPVAVWKPFLSAKSPKLHPPTPTTAQG